MSPVLLPQAVYQKAEILFLTGNYQLSSVYYKRGQKLDPDSPRFQQGIQRSTQALQKFGGGEYTRQLFILKFSTYLLICFCLVSFTRITQFSKHQL